MARGAFPARTRDFPFAHAWFHRDIYRGRGWSFGFFLAPRPGIEHCEGDMVMALIVVEGWFCLSPLGWRCNLWTDDPATRPIGHNAE